MLERLQEGRGVVRFSFAAVAEPLDRAARAVRAAPAEHAACSEKSACAEPVPFTHLALAAKSLQIDGAVVFDGHAIGEGTAETAIKDQ